MFKIISLIVSFVSGVGALCGYCFGRGIKLKQKNRSPKPKTWSRKGRCPVCSVSTGSKHSVGCAYRYN